MAQSEKKAPDWERIETDYRAGLLSVREIAASQGISHTAIQKRAKTDGWERDLSAKIKAKADSLVAKQEVANRVATERVETDKAIVDANAQVIAGIRIAHRTDINRSRQLVMSLLSELEEQTGGIDLYKQLGELMAAPDDKGVDKLNELYHKVISLSGRTGTMKSLSDSLKTLVTLEREAYGIAEAQKVEMFGKDGGPIQTESKLDMTGLTDEQVRAIASIKLNA
jgi:hypothetical protein